MTPAADDRPVLPSEGSENETPPPAGGDEAAILRAIVEGDDSMFFSVDTDFLYTLFNARHAATMKALYGCEIELGRSILDYQTVAMDREGARSNLERALRGERVVESAYSGDALRDRRFYEVTHDPVTDAAGVVIGVAVRAKDVTELRRAREQLTIRHRAIESSINAIAIAGLDRLLTYVNPAFLALWGYDDEGEVIGRPAVDFWESQRDAAEIEAAMLKTGGWSGELAARRRDGSEFVAQITTSLILDDAGAPLGAMAALLDVTERMREHRELNESEARFRGLFEHSMLGVALHEIVLDDDGTPIDYVFLDANPAFEASTGLRVADIVGKRVTEILPGVEQTPFIAVYGDVALAGKTVSFEQHAEPLGRHYAINAYPLGAGRFASVFEDITERKRVEEDLRATSQLLSLAQRAAGAGIWDWDMPSGRLTWSPEFFALFGLAPEAEASFDTWRASLHPDDLQAAEERISEAVEQHVALDDEYRIVRPDGDEVWIGALGDTSYDESGAPLRMTGICFDITERKRVEAALLESEQKWRRVLIYTPQIGVSLDREARIVFANRHFLELTGWTEDEVLGQDWFDLCIPEPIRAQVREIFTKVVSRQDVAGFSTYENEILTRSGEARNVAWSNVVTNDIAGAVVDVTSLGVDITERVRAEAEIRRLNADLERRVSERTAQLLAANQELEAFAYSISHDLRAPLRAIDGFSQILIEDYQEALDGDGRDSLERVRAAAQKMGRLIDDLLSLSRLSRRQMNVTDVDLSRLAAEIVGRLKGEDPERQVEATIAAGCMAHSDAGLLEALLENLLGNAWKFTGKEEDAHIEFAETRLDGERVFWVRDDGAGFDAAYVDKLFQPFQRLHRSDEFPGTGIGLAIVQRIATRLGGRCWAEGAVGEGATFFFTLGVPVG